MEDSKVIMIIIFVLGMGGDYVGSFFFFLRGLYYIMLKWYKILRYCGNFLVVLCFFLIFDGGRNGGI